MQRVVACLNRSLKSMTWSESRQRPRAPDWSDESRELFQQLWLQVTTTALSLVSTSSIIIYKTARHCDDALCFPWSRTVFGLDTYTRWAHYDVVSVFSTNTHVRRCLLLHSYRPLQQTRNLIDLLEKLGLHRKLRPALLRMEINNVYT